MFYIVNYYTSNISKEEPKSKPEPSLRAASSASGPLIPFSWGFIDLTPITPQCPAKSPLWVIAFSSHSCSSR